MKSAAMHRGQQAPPPVEPPQRLPAHLPVALSFSFEGREGLKINNKK